MIGLIQYLPNIKDVIVPLSLCCKIQGQYASSTQCMGRVSVPAQALSFVKPSRCVLRHYTADASFGISSSSTSI